MQQLFINFVFKNDGLKIFHNLSEEQFITALEKILDSKILNEQQNLVLSKEQLLIESQCK